MTQISDSPCFSNNYLTVNVQINTKSCSDSIISIYCNDIHALYMQPDIKKHKLLQYYLFNI